MTDLITTKFGLPSKLTNDANAAAVGEMLYGCAKNMKHFITITLGTGVGSGIIIDGKIVVGHDGFAGELGHTIIRPGGRLHKGTGMKGSLESYASATGVRETAIELITTYPQKETLLRNYSINEHFRLMGFQDGELEFANQSYQQLCKRAANGWDINLASNIFIAWQLDR
jgi:glucokinase